MTDVRVPRVAPVSPPDRTEEQRALLEPLGGDGALAIFATLAHHPGLLRRWLPFGGKLLLGGRLPARDRELIILRSALRCGAAYEWAQHVAMGREAGLTDSEMRLLNDPGVDRWPREDADLLSAVDEVLDDHRIGDASWEALAARYDTEQLIEVPMLAGHYAMLAGVLGSLGVVPDSPELPKLGEV
jgi:alkylhydroperoxidase family enzyme